ncbi:MAG: serine hydrolase domain-containing protein, partial [Microthrixaceae bacterium]
MDNAADRLMEGGDELGRTDALLVSRGGQIVLERYGPEIDESTTLRSWSMAKSMLHAAVGILVDRGELNPDLPAAVPEWSASGDPRSGITLWDLLRMRPGLKWNEDYVDGEGSDVIEMLFAREWDPVADTGGYAADKPLAAPPDTVLNYSSGTSNIVSRIVRDVVGRGDDYETWLRQELFGPLGMASAAPRFDEVGTWIASSYCFCTARDFAKFGELYRHDGVTAEGERVLPEGWADHGRTQVAHDPTDDLEHGFGYGRHWWMWPQYPRSMAAHGYEGQF